MQDGLDYVTMESLRSLGRKFDAMNLLKMVEVFGDNIQGAERAEIKRIILDSLNTETADRIDVARVQDDEHMRRIRQNLSSLN